MHSKSRLESWKMDPLRLIRERKVKRINKCEKYVPSTRKKKQKNGKEKRKTEHPGEEIKKKRNIWKRETGNIGTRRQEKS